MSTQVKEHQHRHKQSSFFPLTSLNQDLNITQIPIQLNHSKKNKTQLSSDFFNIQNRRYLWNKHKLLWFINQIIQEKCWDIDSICDIFAWTWSVWAYYSKKGVNVVSNDLLYSNYVCLKTFLWITNIIDSLEEKISYLNNLHPIWSNYFSEHYGDTYFSMENARKIWCIRNEIDKISQHEDEKNALLCSLIYATDKVANTVGHYDAYRKKLDSLQWLKLLSPNVIHQNNAWNKVFNLDANILIRDVHADVLYLDPPYNSRQYCDNYHLLENLATRNMPDVYWVAKKMNRSKLKSDYSLIHATKAFEDLIKQTNCKHIVLSYNNCWENRNSRSNAKISDNNIMSILSKKWKVEIFEMEYSTFTTWSSKMWMNRERLFYCKVDNGCR